jgi:putative NADH-flavin reductase
MKIVVFGTGFVGAALANELAVRGHDVTAVSRSGNPLHSPVTTVAGSVHDEEFLRAVTAGAQDIVSALPSATVGPSLASAVAGLVRAAETRGARLGVVGGASTIPVHDGQPAEGDTSAFPDRFAPLHHAHLEARAVLAAAPASVDWFYLIPAGQFGAYNPGTRTGRYRTSSTSQVTDGEGRSLLGVEDYAIAFADEIETPHTHRTWLAVGY